MIAASHMVVGTAIGASTERARFAIPLAFASHFVLDQIPHSCFNMLPDSTCAGLSGVLVIAGAIFAYAIAVMALIWAWTLPSRWAAVAGTVAAVIPDPLSYIAPFNEWFSVLPGSWVVPWVHRTFHCDVTRDHVVLGFATQVVVVVIGLWVLAWKKKHNKKPTGLNTTK